MATVLIGGGAPRPSPPRRLRRPSPDGDASASLNPPGPSRSGLSRARLPAVHGQRCIRNRGIRMTFAMDAGCAGRAFLARGRDHIMGDLYGT